ncbi:hypothetical protein J4462_04345 [Candidatus Pacearchaeota archaeon]|nr:hypothetical protein [Candidatus Pacearchaeota archaeon]
MDVNELEKYNGGFVRAFYRYGGNERGFVHQNIFFVPDVRLEEGHLIAIARRVDINRIDTVKKSTPTDYEDVVRSAYVSDKGVVRIEMAVPLRFIDEIDYNGNVDAEEDGDDDLD